MSCAIESTYHPPRWAVVTLVAAGAYNLLWGAWILAAPAASLALLGLGAKNYSVGFLPIWQCVGMLVGVYGFGYLLAARNPAQHWPIVLVGLLGKLCGPLGFIMAAWQGDLPWTFGATLLVNDLLWWIPLVALLVHAMRVRTNTAPAGEARPLAEVLREVESHRGRTLAELSQEQPVLVLFLRHAGCTFCREALSDLARQRSEIEATGATLAIVHLDDRQHGAELTRRYALDDVHRFSDPHCELYLAFDLERGRMGQLFGLTVIRRALPALLSGHGLGRVRGDAFRMPGTFVLSEGKILAAHRHRTAADRPNYAALAREAQHVRPVADVF